MSLELLLPLLLLLPPQPCTTQVIKNELQNTVSKDTRTSYDHDVYARKKLSSLDMDDILEDQEPVKTPSRGIIKNVDNGLPLGAVEQIEGPTGEQIFVGDPNRPTLETISPQRVSDYFSETALEIPDEPVELGSVFRDSGGDGGGGKEGELDKERKPSIAESRHRLSAEIDGFVPKAEKSFVPYEEVRSPSFQEAIVQKVAKPKGLKAIGIEVRRSSVGSAEMSFDLDEEVRSPLFQEALMQKVAKPKGSKAVGIEGRRSSVGSAEISFIPDKEVRSPSFQEAVVQKVAKPKGSKAIDIEGRRSSLGSAEMSFVPDAEVRYSSFQEAVVQKVAKPIGSKAVGIERRSSVGSAEMLFVPDEVRSKAVGMEGKSSVGLAEMSFVSDEELRSPSFQEAVVQKVAKPKESKAVGIEVRSSVEQHQGQHLLEGVEIRVSQTTNVREEELLQQEGDFGVAPEDAAIIGGPQKESGKKKRENRRVRLWAHF